MVGRAVGVVEDPVLGGEAAGEGDAERAEERAEEEEKDEFFHPTDATNDAEPLSSCAPVVPRTSARS